MKANELMIGDWVFAIDCAKPNAYRVTKINAQPEKGEYPIHIDRPADGLPNTFLDFDQVEPIPLTTEILEKNFRKDEQWSNTYYINDHIHIYRDKGFWNIQYMELLEINYVHELQHTLKLCGIKKEIEL